MSVYVDPAVWSYGRMKMCHMVADSLDELHAMADSIGIHRKHFQEGKGHDHYDICKSKRNLAIQNGAIEVTAKEIVRICRKNRINSKN